MQYVLNKQDSVLHLGNEKSDIKQLILHYITINHSWGLLDLVKCNIWLFLTLNDIL